MSESSGGQAPRRQKLSSRRRHHSTVYSRSMDWELQGGIAGPLHGDTGGAVSAGNGTHGQAQAASPPGTPTGEPHRAEEFVLLSYDIATQVQLEPTSTVARARTPPRATTPPRADPTPDLAGTGAKLRSSNKSRGACGAARAPETTERREVGLPISAPTPSRSLATKDAAVVGAVAPNVRRTQSHDWESMPAVRARTFGRECPLSSQSGMATIAQAPNLLQDASDMLREMGSSMRSVSELDEIPAS